MKKMVGGGTSRTPEEVRLADQVRADGIRQAVQERWVPRSGAQQKGEVVEDAEVT